MKHRILAVAAILAVSTLGACEKIYLPTEPAAAQQDTAQKVVLPPFPYSDMAADISPSEYGVELAFYAPANFIPDAISWTDNSSVLRIDNTTKRLQNITSDGRTIWLVTTNFWVIGAGDAHLSIILKNASGQQSTIHIIGLIGSDGGKG